MTDYDRSMRATRALLTNPPMTQEQLARLRHEGEYRHRPEVLRRILKEWVESGWLTADEVREIETLVEVSA